MMYNVKSFHNHKNHSNYYEQNTRVLKEVDLLFEIQTCYSIYEPFFL